jgi:DNA-binding XRE family transcriptional regulator
MSASFLGRSIVSTLSSTPRHSQAVGNTIVVFSTTIVLYSYRIVSPRPERPMTEKRRLGTLIRGHRLLAGLSADQVADLAGIPRRTYSSYEAGTREPGALNLLRIMAVLKINAVDLIDRVRNQELEGAR